MLHYSILQGNKFLQTERTIWETKRIRGNRIEPIHSLRTRTVLVGMVTDSQNELRYLQETEPDGARICTCEWEKEDRLWSFASKELRLYVLVYILTIYIELSNWFTQLQYNWIREVIQREGDRRTRKNWWNVQH